MKRKIFEAIRTLAQHEISSYEYELAANNIIRKLNPKYKIGDIVILKTNHGVQQGEIVEVTTPNINCFKMYRIYINSGYVWWKEKDITKAVKCK